MLSGLGCSLGLGSFCRFGGRLLRFLFLGGLFGGKCVQIHLAHNLGSFFGIDLRSHDFLSFGFLLGFGLRRFSNRFRLGALHLRCGFTFAELAEVDFRLVFSFLGCGALFGAGQRDAFTLLNRCCARLGFCFGFLVALEIGFHQGIRLGIQLGVGLGLDLDAFGREELNHGGHAKVELTGGFAQAYRFV